MQRRTITILRWFVIAYLTYVTALFLFQRQFLYHPMDDPISGEEQAYELNNAGTILRGWVINPGKQKAVLYYGGNAERISNSIEISRSLFKDFSVYLVHYRGFGDSEGEPTEQNLYADALAIYDDIQPSHTNIAVVGRSLGTAIATYVASQREVSHTALITPFDSIEHIAEERYIGVPISLLLKDKFESWKYASAVTTKTLALIAENDYVVPRRFSDNLLQHFNKELISSVVLDGTNHYSISNHPDYYPLIQRFISEQ